MFILLITPLKLVIRFSIVFLSLLTKKTHVVLNVIKQNITCRLNLNFFMKLFSFFVLLLLNQLLIYKYYIECKIIFKTISIFLSFEKVSTSLVKTTYNVLKT